ncbi:MAG: acyltransferase [Glaciimonas sp.]|nr:acyltransferase [Glaciimonas sp.]
MTIGKNFSINWPHQLKIGDNVRIGIGMSLVIDGIWSDIGFISIENQVEIKDYVKLIKKSDSKCVIGQTSFIGDNVNISIASDLIIERDCLIASGVRISDTNHLYGKDIENRKCATINAFINIKAGTWIGLNACILSGVIISENSVIAAGSVVNKDIPEWEIWGGIPAKYLKRIQ